MREVHPEEYQKPASAAAPLPPGVTLEPNQCDICFRVFKLPRSLLTHKKVNFYASREALNEIFVHFHNKTRDWSIDRTMYYRRIDSSVDRWIIRRIVDLLIDIFIDPSVGRSVGRLIDWVVGNTFFVLYIGQSFWLRWIEVRHLWRRVHGS